ncbi:MAG TPA: ECF transporter S component, partial [Peptostreptococcaceae bacterium]|nr:ECF transporter S component [Peptostreptococcaceae bacterium]
MKTKKITLVALFIALSFIGSNIKIFSSIAFDSMPGFLISIMLGPVYGAIVGLLGHLLTAITSGFPMTIPIHLIIGIFMAITIYIFGVSYRIFKDKNKLLSWVVPTLLGVIINGPITVY